MPYLSPDEYICLTHATEKAMVITRNGQVEFDVADIPAVLNTVTNGQFKMEWAPHLFARAHIVFEKLDTESKFDEMRAMLASNAKLAKFLRFHMKITSGVWTWRFSE